MFPNLSIIRWGAHSRPPALGLIAVIKRTFHTLLFSFLTSVRWQLLHWTIWRQEPGLRKLGIWSSRTSRCYSSLYFCRVVEGLDRKSPVLFILTFDTVPPVGKRCYLSDSSPLCKQQPSVALCHIRTSLLFVLLTHFLYSFEETVEGRREKLD